MGRTHAPVDAAEQRQWRIEKRVVAGEPLAPRGLVLTRNVEPRIHRFADGKTPVAVRRHQLARVDVVFTAFTARVFRHAFTHDLLESGQRIAADHVQVPWLQVAAGRCTQRIAQNTADHIGWHRRVKKMAHRTAAGNGLTNVHVRSRRARFLRWHRPASRWRPHRVAAGLPPSVRRAARWRWRWRSVR